MRRLKSLIFVFFFFAKLTHAAELMNGGLNFPGCDKLIGETHCMALSLVGKILPGDSHKLEKKIRSIEGLNTPSKSIRIGVLILDSTGGDLAEAMRIGRLLRSRQMATFVTYDTICASAGVFILAAGVKRIAFGPVVIHSFYVPDLLGAGEFTRTSKILDKAVSESDADFREMRVSRAIVDAMLQVQHSAAEELSLEKLIAFGLVGQDPAYFQSLPKK